MPPRRSPYRLVADKKLISYDSRVGGGETSPTLDKLVVYGGTGKAFVSWSESNAPVDDNGFESDGILSKDVTPVSNIYVRFDLKFQPGWAGGSGTDGGLAKLFRITSWDGPLEGTGERYYFGNNGNSISTKIRFKTQRRISHEAIFFSRKIILYIHCLLYTSPSPRDRQKSRMPSSA